jgi:arginase
MADHSSGRHWDPIVAPWHLDEHIPAFPIPAGAETICPALPAGPVSDRMDLLHHAVADAVARADRPLLLTGDCPNARPPLPPYPPSVLGSTDGSALGR